MGRALWALSLWALVCLPLAFLHPLFLLGPFLAGATLRAPRAVPLLALLPLLLAWWVPWGLILLPLLLCTLERPREKTDLDKVRAWMRERPGCRIRASWAGRPAHLCKEWQVSGRLTLLGVDTYKTRGVERDNECIFWILLHQRRGLLTGNVAQVFKSPQGSLKETNEYLKGVRPPTPGARVPRCLLSKGRYRHPIMV